MSRNLDLTLDRASNGSDEHYEFGVANCDQSCIETDLLPSFCIHEDNLMLGSGWSQEIIGVG